MDSVCPHITYLLSLE